MSLVLIIFSTPIITFSQFSGRFNANVWFGDESGSFQPINLEFQDNKAFLCSENWEQISELSISYFKQSVTLHLYGGFLLLTKRVDGDLDASWHAPTGGKYSIKTGLFYRDKLKKEIDNSVYQFVDKMPEFKDGTIAFQEEILGEMAQNPIFKNGNYNTTIVVNKDKTLEIKTISGSGVLIDKKIMNELGSIIESKKAIKCGYHNNNPVRVQQILFLKLTDDVRKKSNIENTNPKSGKNDN